MLHPAERPDFVALHALRGEVADLRIVKLRARGSDIAKKPENRGFRNARHANDGVDGDAFHESGNDTGADFRIQTVRAQEYACSGKNATLLLRIVESC